MIFADTLNPIHHAAAQGHDYRVYLIVIVVFLFMIWFRLRALRTIAHNQTQQARQASILAERQIKEAKKS